MTSIKDLKYEKQIDQLVYKLYGLAKEMGTHHLGFASDVVFKTYGFTFGRVVAANAADMTLPVGPLVKFRDGTLVNDQGTILVISDGKKIGFRSMNALLTRGYVLKNAINAKLDAYEASPAVD